MANRCLEKKAEKTSSQKTANERAYLSSIMPEARQEGYTCVTGCSSCVSCDGNGYVPRN